jgi:hypothetical protein
LRRTLLYLQRQHYLLKPLILVRGYPMTAHSGSGSRDLVRSEKIGCWSVCGALRLSGDLAFHRKVCHSLAGVLPNLADPLFATLLRQAGHDGFFQIRALWMPGPLTRIYLNLAERVIHIVIHGWGRIA